MPIAAALPTFTANTLASAADITTAFTTLRDTINTYGLLTDVARTVTVTNTYTLTQTFTGGWTAGAACTVSTGGLTVTAGGLTVSASGITVTGNSTITGTLGGVTTATIATMAGAVNFTGTPTFAAGITVTGNSTITGTLGSITTLTCTTVTATNLGGSLTTASQTAITAVGTLTSLTVSGNVTLSAADSVVTYGSSSTTFRDGNTKDTLTLAVGGDTAGGAIAVFGDVSDGYTRSDVVILPPQTEARQTGFLRIGVIGLAPSGAASDGCMVLDEANHRLYLRSNGAWKYAALT